MEESSKGGGGGAVGGSAMTPVFISTLGTTERDGVRERERERERERARATGGGERTMYYALNM